MYSPTRLVPAISPARSTPSLEYDAFEAYSPPDDYLATPDPSEWREIRRLEHQKMHKESQPPVDVLLQYELPSLDVLSQNQEPLLSELPPQLPQWPHSTIAPKDAFPDYQEVHQFLQEQARPSSPSAFSDASSPVSRPYTPYHDYDHIRYDLHACASARSPSSEVQPTPSTSAASPVNIIPSSATASSRRVGKKAKREEDTEYEPAAKRRMAAPQSVKGKARAQSLSYVEDESDDNEQYDVDFDIDLADDDESGDFQPARRLAQSRRKPQSTARGPVRLSATPRVRAAPPVARRISTNPKTKSNRGEDYQEGPCGCQDDACTNCQMTCFYTFVHGPRKGEVCRRLFESGRHLDLRRHKATHAVQEWKWLQDGEITADMAYWHSVVFHGKEHGLMCPNGDCKTTFTRYDALKRHMERGTCQYAHLESSKENLETRQIKAKVIRESDAKYQRVAAARVSEAKHT